MEGNSSDGQNGHNRLTVSTIINLTNEYDLNQLGWHLDELPSYTANLKFYLKKKGEIQEGGLWQTLENKKAKKHKKELKNNKDNRLGKSKPRHTR